MIVNLHHLLDWHRGDALLSVAGREFPESFNEQGRQTLHMDNAIPWGSGLEPHREGEVAPGYQQASSSAC